jgi:hypothetical protein
MGASREGEVEAVLERNDVLLHLNSLLKLFPGRLLL